MLYIKGQGFRQVDQDPGQTVYTRDRGHSSRQKEPIIHLGSRSRSHRSKKSLSTTPYTRSTRPLTEYAGNVTLTPKLEML